MNEIINAASERMDKSISSLNQAFNKIRTGRANPSILDGVKVDYYVTPTVLNQAASISVEDGRSLVISPWDKSLIPEIEKAIMNSNLGLNPSTSSDLMLKATRVDGVYDSDPEVNENAEFFSELSFDDAISKNLKVMDATALTLARDHKLPIKVFNVNTPDALKNIICGEKIGTLVS